MGWWPDAVVREPWTFLHISLSWRAAPCLQQPPPGMMTAGTRPGWWLSEDFTHPQVLTWPGMKPGDGHSTRNHTVLVCNTERHSAFICISVNVMSQFLVYIRLL